MATWGRSTDIEFVYGITAPRGTGPGREIIQTTGHQWVGFAGPRKAGHPELWVSTDNNMVADHGDEDLIRFAPAPMLVDLNGVSREQTMDDEPWTYVATSAEMRREGRITVSTPDGAGRMADPRRYVVVEACADVSDAALALEIGVRDADGRVAWYASDLGLPTFRVARSGCFRGGVPLPASASHADISGVRLRAFPRSPSGSTTPTGRVVLRRVNQLLLLDDDFRPIHVAIRWTGAEAIALDGEGFAVTLPSGR